MTAGRIDAARKAEGVSAIVVCALPHGALDRGASPGPAAGHVLAAAAKPGEAGAPLR